MIDLSQVRVVGSPTACLSFPKTARLTHFGATQTAITIRTTGTDAWPVISIADKPGPEDDQAGTLWILTRPEGPTGPWYATGAERLRPAQLNGDKPQGAPNVPDTLAVLIGQGWLYDTGRWGRMAGYNPAPGEPVGVMVVAGSTRSDDRTPLQERTQMRVIAWPAFPGANPCQVLWEESDDAVVPAPTPAPTLPSDLEARLVALETLVRDQGRLMIPLAERLQALESAQAVDLTSIEARILTLETAVGNLAARKIPTHTKPLRLPWVGAVRLELE